MKNKRESNFELLRIISMVMVITLHYLGHGGVLSGVDKFSANFVIVNLLESFSIYAVNIYVLISAYFLSDSTFRINRVVKTWVQVVIYSGGIYILLTLMGLIKFNIIDLVKSFLPIIFNQYSFVSAYIIILLLSPYFNKLINTLSKMELVRLNSILIVIFSILNVGFKLGAVTNSYLVNFIVLYFISAYIKRYYDFKIKNIYYLLSFIICSIIIFVGRYGLYYIGKDGVTDVLLSYSFIIVIIGAVSLFIYFKNLSIKSKIINNISILTFGVYLIHDNVYLREILYRDILKSYYWYNDEKLVVMIIISVFFIFICGCSIEKIRIIIGSKINIIDMIYDKSVNFRNNKFSKKIEKFKKSNRYE